MLQGPFDIAADLDTPVSAYLKLGSFQPRFLLESVERGEHLARYSFIGFGDAMRVNLDATGFFVDDECLTQPKSSVELLDCLREALRRTPRPEPEVPGLPFTGGLVGAAGYELVRHFERLPGKAAQSPGQAVATYVAPESVLVFDHLTRRAALLHAGSSEERIVLRREIMRALRGRLPAGTKDARVEMPKASLSAEEFQYRVAKCKDYIRSGDVYQLVLSICFEGACDLEPFEAYRALRLLNPSPYMYFCELGNVTVAGSSPEALVRLNGSQASLRPIAGTRPRGETDGQDQVNEMELVADPKEKSEHVMLVDLARNDLGRVAKPGTVHVDPLMAVERYSHVMHLVSGVQGELEAGKDAFDLFAAAFPAGTLVGAPKVRAMELIAEFEPKPRGFYAGTVGYFGNGGDMDQAIAIRTLVFENGRYSYQAGAGIVADSVPENEYNEVLAKSAVLNRAVAMAAEGL